jgi:1-acyl-sn-glycerol-3-phosphate acyltransferase
LLFALLKLPARLAFWIYCRRLYATHKDRLRSKGPLLIAANHPNSFLDAIVLATLFRQPIYSLARGDAFAGGFISRILRQLNILPVYRLSEGAENLGQNYSTFDACRDIFKQNGIVLIFIEGRCINEWHLRPLMKGAARLALSSWAEGIPLTILPVGINYQSFSRFGKNIHLHWGSIVTAADIDQTQSQGKAIADFNKKLTTQLQQLVYEIDKADFTTLRQIFHHPLPAWKKYLLVLPAFLGKWLHWPLYAPLYRFFWKKLAHNDHFDSAMIGALFMAYPFYLLLLILPLWWITAQWYWWLLVLVLPFCAWARVQVKEQF